MTWITEATWPTFLVASILAVLCGVRWHRVRSVRYIVAIALLGALCGAVYYTDRSIITDRERIEHNVVDMTDAFRRKDFDRCWSYFSPSATSLKGMLREAMDIVDVQDDLRITDRNVKLMAQNSRATSHFRANATISLRGVNLSRQPSRWELTWQRENSEWKVVKVTRLDYLKGTELDPLSQRRR